VSIDVNLVRFTWLLRSEGVPVVPGSASVMLAALAHVDLARQSDVREALRAVTVSRPEQDPIFDRAFDALFGGDTARSADTEDPDQNAAPDETIETWVVRHLGADENEEPDEDVADQSGASAIERIADRDFSDLTDDELEEARRLVAAMAWAPSQVASRRWHPMKTGTRPDMRSTLRQMVGPRGDLLPLAMAARRPRRRPLVVIADVSGSMEAYAEMMLTFAHAARARIGRVETFTFSTRLTRVTWELTKRDVRQALTQVSSAVDDWSGGTKIGEALRDFNVEWSRRVCRGGPVVLIVSDGWDCGEIELLDREMARLARSVSRVVWLNPLAGRAGYSPETRGMKTVLPYVDDFLPAASLSDLAQVIGLLESVGDVR